MKLLIILVFSAIPFLVNAQTKNEFSIGFQVQPELTFYKSRYVAVNPQVYSKSSFNIGFNLYGQYQITDHLFATLGLGFISRKLNTQIHFDKSLLPEPYYDSVAGPAIFTNTLSYRILQIPVGMGYNFFKTKKTNVYASLTFIPNFLLNAKYNIPNYPTFKKNYWQGFSVNPNIGMDYALTQKINLTSAIAYSLVNTVREEEYSSRHPQLKHQYLQLGLGLKLKL